MKKIVVLLGIAAAAFGAVKLLRGKEAEIAEPYQQPYQNDQQLPYEHAA